MNKAVTSEKLDEDLLLKGDVKIGTDTTNTITVNSDIIPSGPDTIDLGTNTNRFGSIYCNDLYGTTNSIWLGMSIKLVLVMMQ